MKHRGNRNVHILANQLARVVHNHHGSIIKIRHALVIFLAFFENKDTHGLARQDDGLQRIRQFVDVQNLHALKLGYLIQIEVVGDDLGLVHLGQLNQL